VVSCTADLAPQAGKHHQVEIGRATATRCWQAGAAGDTAVGARGLAAVGKQLAGAARAQLPTVVAVMAA